MLLLVIYPLLLIFLYGLSLFAKRDKSRGGLGAITHLLLFLSFLLPWILILTTIIKGNYPDISIGVSHLTKNADLWILGCQAMLAVVLLLVKNRIVSQEAWLKSVMSLFFGILFLHLSLHPTTGIGFAISTEIAQCISAIGFVVGIFFLFGLPPLQLGAIDLGSERNASLNIFLNVLPRFALAFVILFAMTFANWLGDLEFLQGLIAGSIFLGVALTRLVLRLQTNVFRTFSYLSSGLALSIAAKILFSEFGDLLLFVQVLFTIPLLMILNDEPKESGSDRHLQNWASFRTYHQTAAQRFHVALKAFLYMECAAGLALSVSLVIRGYWLVAICVLISSFSALVVTQDKQAFAPQALT
ncbi:MAG: hypothetical protein H7318_19895 [Oligoflexus sp.]|nr:hypothetical protein [Oligoflexus sp.]